MQLIMKDSNFELHEYGVLDLNNLLYIKMFDDCGVHDTSYFFDGYKISSVKIQPLGQQYYLQIELNSDDKFYSLTCSTFDIANAIFKYLNDKVLEMNQDY